MSTSGGNTGVLGETLSTTGAALKGAATATSGVNYGLHATTQSASGRAVFGQAPGSAHAGFFDGRVHIAGTLSKGGGSFKIDHPLDPEHKYLSHSFVESPDMLNVYNGNVVLDEAGEAWVELPGWFGVLTRDFRYQLTAIGAPGPNLHIAKKITDNRCTIAGGTKGIDVSWQVTGIRQDPWANQNRIPVEEDKQPDERGTYMHPTAWGQPEERGLEWRLQEGHRRELRGLTSPVAP